MELYFNFILCIKTSFKNNPQALVNGHIFLPKNEKIFRIHGSKYVEGKKEAHQLASA